MLKAVFVAHMHTMHEDVIEIKYVCFLPALATGCIPTHYPISDLCHIQLQLQMWRSCGYMMQY